MKHLLRISFVFLVLLLSVTVLRSNTDPKEVIEAAAAAYNGEDWDQAIAQYESLLNVGYQSAPLYYNLGNAYYQSGNLGQSILHYKRGLRLKPGDKDLQHNLELAAGFTRNDLIPLPPFFLSRAWKGVFQLFPRNIWRVLWLVFLYVGIGGILIWMLGKKGEWRRRAFAGGFLALLISVLCFAAMMSRKNFDLDPGPAVLMAGQSSLYSAADLASPVIREVYEGLQVVITDQIGEMLKVSLKNGEEGWIPTDAIERVFSEVEEEE